MIARALLHCESETKSLSLTGIRQRGHAPAGLLAAVVARELEVVARGGGARQARVRVEVEAGDAEAGLALVGAAGSLVAALADIDVGEDKGADEQHHPGHGREGVDAQLEEDLEQASQAKDPHRLPG